MAIINQQAVVLDSQNQVRNADRLAREWAIAHAGAYQGQARRELGGSGTFREWQHDKLTIRISKPMSSAIKQGQLASVRYEHATDAEPYVAYLLTCAAAASDQSGGCLMYVVAEPDGLEEAELPWDDRAGPAGLEKVVEAVAADRSRPSSAADASRVVDSVDDLFAQHDTAIVLTEDGQQVDELRELADAHGDWATVVSINASELVTIGRRLTMEELYSLVQAKIALFSRYADGAGRRLRMAESEYESAAALLDDARERSRSDIVNRNGLMLMELLECTSDAQNARMLAQAAAIAFGAPEEDGDPAEDAGTESDAPDSVAAQQRIYLLEDQLGEAQKTIAELEERLKQYESYEWSEEEEADASPDAARESVLDSNRYDTVLNAIVQGDQFPRLRFLTNCDKPLADYGKPRPNGTEIVAALGAINKLAQAWYNTPNGAIGPWDNYFKDITGWTHANGESSLTMARYGEKRSFSDQEQGRLVTIQRHLTYRGSSGGLQIYFDKDDVTDRFIIGYIGEHLPYATSRS